MSPRAPALAPADRRRSLIDAAIPLLREHGRAVTTRQLADAAGVAEGTIFRVFDSKDALVDAALAHVLDSEPFLAVLRAIDPDQPLRDRLLDIVTLLQRRFADIFWLMTAMGYVGTPDRCRPDEAHRRAAQQVLVDLVAPDAARLSCTPEHLVQVVRALCFAAAHPHHGDELRLSPAQIVTVVLDGVWRGEGQ